MDEVAANWQWHQMQNGQVGGQPNQEPPAGGETLEREDRDAQE